MAWKERGERRDEDAEEAINFQGFIFFLFKCFCVERLSHHGYKGKESRCVLSQTASFLFPQKEFVFVFFSLLPPNCSEGSRWLLREAKEGRRRGREGGRARPSCTQSCTPAVATASERKEKGWEDRQTPFPYSPFGLSLLCVLCADGALDSN